MMMTSIAYMPAIGIASAGTTLVGQSIGAGDRDWAARVGNAAIKVTVGYMGVVSLVLALAGPWLLPLFLTPGDPSAQQVAALGYLLLWIAAAYQIFDGFNLGCGFCLRGAGDVRCPCSWWSCCPGVASSRLTHMLTFAPGQGWVHFLPQFGLGTVGGWSALLLYTFALGRSDVPALAIGRLAQDRAVRAFPHHSYGMAPIVSDRAAPRHERDTQSSRRLTIMRSGACRCRKPL